MSYEKKWSWEVRLFRKPKQVRYRDTWSWDVGYVDNIMPSFPIFTVVKSSHGYKRLKYGTGYKGPVIKTKAKAIEQAKIALARAIIEDENK